MIGFFTVQFIRIEKGVGVAIINNKKYKLYDGIGLIIPKLKQMSNPDKGSKKGSKKSNKK